VQDRSSSTAPATYVPGLARQTAVSACEAWQPDSLRGGSNEPQYLQNRR